MSHNQQEEKYQQIELHIRSSVQSSAVNDGEDDANILLHTKSATTHYNNEYRNELPFEYVEYKLNEDKDKIIVSLYNHDKIIETDMHPNHLNTCCALLKYRSEYILHHRKQRYNIMFIPMYIIFIIFTIYSSTSIYDRINGGNISYINNSINTQFRQNVTNSELESIRMCDIQFDQINGWFDGESFDFRRQQWFDYSIYNNSINSSYIHNKIKKGLFQKQRNNFYIYGSKLNSINIPASLVLDSNNYTIITLARYNGNDRNTIFTSNDSNWIFGFKDMETNVVYHKGFQLNTHNIQTPQPTTYDPTLEPTANTISEHSLQPTINPTLEPTVDPTSEPTLEPTLQFTINDTLRPTLVPISINNTRNPTRATQPTLKLLPTITYTTPKPHVAPDIIPLSFGFKWSRWLSEDASQLHVLDMTLYWSKSRYHCTIYATDAEPAYVCNISDTFECNTADSNSIQYGLEISTEDGNGIFIEQIIINYDFTSILMVENFCRNISHQTFRESVTVDCENGYDAYEAIYISALYSDIMIVFEEAAVRHPSSYTVAYVENTDENPQCTKLYYDDPWIINVDSPQIFRSQQETIYKSFVQNNQDEGSIDPVNKLIKWGVNIFNASDFAVATIFIVTHQLSLVQIECMENFIKEKYNLIENVTNTNDSYQNQSNNTVSNTLKIHECNRWDQSFDDDIVSWYDVNSGFDNNTLFDFSGHSNHIKIDKNIQVGIDIENEFLYLFGATYHDIKISNVTAMNTDPYMLAIYFVARYNGNDQGNIISELPNEFSDFASNIHANNHKWILSSIYIDNSYHNGWYCTQNCEKSFTDYGAGLLDDVLLHPLTINGDYKSEWAITEIIILERKENPLGFLSFRDSMCVEEYLSHKYNIDSYEYTKTSIVSLQFSNWFVLILIGIGGIWISYAMQIGFLAKMCSDVISCIFQSFSFCSYCCCVGCCSCKCCACCCGWCKCCCACCLCMDCCCGTLKGICGRQCCATQISVFPIYNVFSVLSSFTSIANRIFNSRAELIPYLLLNGLCTLFVTIIHFIFIYGYLIGHQKLFDDYVFFYFIQLEICMFLWSIFLFHAIRNCVNDAYWIITFSIYLNLISMVYATSLTAEINYSNIVVAISQSTLMIVVTFTLYFYRVEVNYCLFWSRSILLLLLIISSIPDWNDVYKVWIFSILLVQYIDLYVGDFAFRSSTLPKQYEHLAEQKKR